MEKSSEMKSVYVELASRKASTLCQRLALFGGVFVVVMLCGVCFLTMSLVQRLQYLEVRVQVLERSCNPSMEKEAVVATGRQDSVDIDVEAMLEEEAADSRKMVKLVDPFTDLDIIPNSMESERPRRLKRQSGRRQHKTTTTTSPPDRRTSVSSTDSDIDNNPNEQHKSCPTAAIHLNLNIRNPTDNEMQMLARNEVIDLGHGHLTNLGYLVKKTWSESDNHNAYIYKAWEKANWTGEYAKDFEFNDGYVTVKKKGLYYIYSQILYHNTATRSSYIIKIDDHNFAKCMVSVDAVMEGTSPQDAARYKTCYTGGVKALERNQRISIVDHYSRHVTTDKEANFFGVIRIA